VVAPAAIVTVAGEMLTLFESLLTSVTVTPPVGAGPGSVTWNAADWPRATLTFEGSRIAPLPCTVTVAVPFETFGETVLAVIVVDPTATPVTEIVVVLNPGPMFAVAGMLMIPAVLLAKVTNTPPAGAGADSVRIRGCDAVPVSVKVAGEKVSVAPTVTFWLVVPKPGAVAVIEDDPKATPVTLGCVGGCVRPAETVTVAGEMVTFVGSLLVKVTITPPVGAGLDKTTG
jgi:hypothetical protein